MLARPLTDAVTKHCRSWSTQSVAFPRIMFKEVSEDMPGPKSSGQPTAAQNQQGTQNKPPLAKGTKKQASDGQEYEWKGAQWVSTKTGRMATKQISAELGK